MKAFLFDGNGKEGKNWNRNMSMQQSGIKLIFETFHKKKKTLNFHLSKLNRITFYKCRS